MTVLGILCVLCLAATVFCCIYKDRADRSGEARWIVGLWLIGTNVFGLLSIVLFAVDMLQQALKGFTFM